MSSSHDSGAREKKKECEARLRSLVHRDERILAVGTAEELASLGSEIGSGGGWTFIVVTSQRVLFASWHPAQTPPVEIWLDEVTGWASGTQYNCEALVLTHPFIPQRQQVAAHRVLWFEWGDVEAEVGRPQTIFRFSRPDTRVVKALRSSLSERNGPYEALHFEERSREERTRGRHAALRVNKH